MNIQILPNWFKKIGILIFIMFAILAGGDGFIDGYNEAKDNSALDQIEHATDERRDSTQLLENSEVFSSYFGSELMHLFNILSIIGLIIYMISKEKIEDDYINKLRADSFQLSIFIFLLVSLVSYITLGNLKMPLDYFLFLYIMLFLIIFSIKKRVY